MSKKGLALGLLVFLFGAAAGALAMRVYLERHLFEAFGPPRGPRVEDIIGHIDETVGLRPDQKERIRPYVKELITEFERFHQESEPRLDAVAKRFDGAVMAELDPEQQKRFAAFLARMEKMRQVMRPGHAD